MQTFRCVIADHGAPAAVVDQVAAVVNSVPHVSCATVAAPATCETPADLLIICWGAGPWHLLALLIAQCRGRDPRRNVIVVAELQGKLQLGSLFNLGVADFVRLPIEATELRARIERALGVLACDPERPVAQWLGSDEPFLCSVSPRLNAQLARLPALAGQGGDVLVCGEHGTGRRAFVRQMVRLTGGAKPIELDPEVSSAAACEQMLDALLADSQSESFAALSAICGNVLIVHDLELMSERTQQLMRQLIQVRARGSRSSGVRVIASAADNKSETPHQSPPALQQLQRHLSTLRVRMPPLRERREDILPLARLFLTRHCAELGRAVPAMTPAAARYLMTHEWRGNVRELRDVIVRAAESKHSDLLGVSDLIGESSSGVIPAELSLQQTKTQLIVSFERTFLEHLLQTCHGNINKAARVAQKNRRALFELIRKHEIDVEQYRAVR